MAEKGFATIFGLCLIFVIALLLKGIQASETSHIYETADYQSEFDLQNAADSAIYAAADKVFAGEVTLPVKVPPYYNREQFQHKFDTIQKNSQALGKITVEVWGERVTLNHLRELYPSYKRTLRNSDEAYIFFSMAQSKSKHTGGQIYRRAFAYVLKNGDQTIHFME